MIRGGLSSYTRTLDAGGGSIIGARGRTIVYRDGVGPLTIVARRNNINSGGGQPFALELKPNDKWICDDEFDQVEISNPGDTQRSYELLIGYGDFVIMPQLMPGVTPTIKRSHFAKTGPRPCNFWWELLPENLRRTRFRYSCWASFDASAGTSGAQIRSYGRRKEPCEFTEFLFSVLWSTTNNNAFSKNDSPALPTLFPGQQVASGFSYFGPNTATSATGAGGFTPGNVNIPLARTTLRFPFSSSIAQTDFDHLLLEDCAGVMHRFNTADAAFASNEFVWPLPGTWAFPSVASETRLHRARIVVSGETDDMGAAVFGSGANLTTASAGAHNWSEWINSTDAFNVHVTHQRLRSLVFDFEEEVFE